MKEGLTKEALESQIEKLEKANLGHIHPENQADAHGEIQFEIALRRLALQALTPKSDSDEVTRLREALENLAYAADMYRKAWDGVDEEGAAEELDALILQSRLLLNKAALTAPAKSEVAAPSEITLMSMQTGIMREQTQRAHRLDVELYPLREVARLADLVWREAERYEEAGTQYFQVSPHWMEELALALTKVSCLQAAPVTAKAEGEGYFYGHRKGVVHEGECDCRRPPFYNNATLGGLKNKLSARHIASLQEYIERLEAQSHPTDSEKVLRKAAKELCVQACYWGLDRAAENQGSEGRQSKRLLLKEANDVVKGAELEFDVAFLAVQRAALAPPPQAADTAKEV